jgi:hypothetical protein
MERQLTLHEYLSKHPAFNGADCGDCDKKRLTGQINRVFSCMKDGRWRTLAEIEEITEDPQASISAQLRNLRKPRFGGYTVERANRGGGLFEYRLKV